MKSIKTHVVCHQSIVNDHYVAIEKLAIEKNLLAIKNGGDQNRWQLKPYRQKNLW
jgi:hypothetical protein